MIEKECGIMRTSSVVLLVASFLMFGCAAESMKVHPLTADTYGYQAKGSPNKDLKIAVLDFKLNTGKSPNTVGEGKTGFFNTLTPIVSKEPANAMVRESLKQGLRGVELNVVDSDDADYRVDGTIERFWVDEYATGMSLEYAKAHVKYDIYVRNERGETVWANTIESFKTSPKSADATQDDIPTLTATLQESVRSFVEDPGFWSALLK
jgi:ABC-type uncharacterized transport system auxiliary subunit